MGLEDYGTDNYKPVLYPIKGFAYICSIYLTVFLCLERYIDVRSLKPSEKTYQIGPNMYTVKLYQIGIGSVILFSVIWNFPKFFEYEFYTTTLNTTSYGKTAFGTTDTYKKGYLAWGFPLVQFFIPILVLIVLNYFLIQKVSS